MLDRITVDGVNLAIWSRPGAPVPADVHADRWDDVAFESAVADVDAGLRGALGTARYLADEAEAFVGDIALLATKFAALLDLDRVLIRLDVVESDACRRFHADYVTARLICTYAGPGTQWLDADDAAVVATGADAGRVTIRQIGTGDVALFKGRLWSPAAPIVHRSPPIAGTGVRRLVLVVDPALDAAIPHR